MDSASTFSVANERDQLVQVWRRRFATRPDPCAEPIVALRRLATGPLVKKAVSDDLRKLHDQFGWMAKESGFAGKCAGALYRSEAFMRLSLAERVGRKPDQTVHIEHTVPIDVLASRWCELRRRGEPQDLLATLKWVLHHSVTTAVRKKEEEALGDLFKSTDCFSDGAVGFGRPFKRYDRLLAQGVRVWDVYQGRLVDADRFTLDDHFANVLALLEEAGASRRFVRDLKDCRLLS